MEFTDRYGGNPPSSLRVCRSRCEGMGCYPDMSQYKDHIDDVQFVKCEVCNGTSKCSWLETLSRIPRWFVGCFTFVARPPARGARRDWRDHWYAFKASFLADLGLF